MMTWAGDVTTGTIAGPTDPWYIAVTNLSFSADGHTAYVTGVVVHSVFPGEIGALVFHAFTDNSGTHLADEVDGLFVEAGSVVVRN